MTASKRRPVSTLAKAVLGIAFAGLAVASLAADKVKIGFVSTLSGPSSALGVDIRDAFLLYVKMNGGKLGGLPAEVLVSDDQFKPDVARQLFERNIKRDHVDFMTGVVFSNIMLAALPEAIDNKVIYVSPNAAPSPMAGKDCNPWFFAVSWPNDAAARPANASPRTALARAGTGRRLHAVMSISWISRYPAIRSGSRCFCNGTKPRFAARNRTAPGR